MNVMKTNPSSNYEVNAAGKAWIKVSRATIETLPDSSAMRHRRLLWDPQAFVIESENLAKKIIESTVQVKSLAAWNKNPKSPMTYVVAGSPDDEKALYFAAHLVDIHRQRLGINADIMWEAVYNGYDNHLIRRDRVPTMMVLTNLSTKSNYLKYDKAKDAITRYGGIPKIVVVTGEDPISFAATRLHVPCHGIAYFGSRLVKTYDEVI